MLFDVVSLFTKVPADLAVAVAVAVASRRLSSDNTSPCEPIYLPRSLSALSSFALISVLTYVFVFFIRGTAMGSQVSVSVPFFGRKSLGFILCLPCWKRYVYDVCTVVLTDRTQYLQKQHSVDS